MLKKPGLLSVLQGAILAGESLERQQKLIDDFRPVDANGKPMGSLTESTNNRSNYGINSLRLEEHSVAEEMNSYEAIFHFLGAPKGGSPVDDAKLQRYLGKFTPDFLDVWRRYGFGSVGDGFCWFCDPDLFAPVVRELFGNDPEFGQMQLLPYACFAFGELYLWEPVRRIVVSVDFIREAVTTVYPEMARLYPEDPESRLKTDDEL